MIENRQAVQVTILVLFLLAGLLWTRRLSNIVMADATEKITANRAAEFEVVSQRVESIDDPIVLFNLGRQLLAKSPHLAVVALSRAVKLEPKFRDAWYLLGYAAVQQGDKAAARQALLTARTLDAGHSPTIDLLKSLGE